MIEVRKKLAQQLYRRGAGLTKHVTLETQERKGGSEKCLKISKSLPNHFIKSVFNEAFCKEAEDWAGSSAGL